jgi:hypothetical protein
MTLLPPSDSAAARTIAFVIANSSDSIHSAAPAHKEQQTILKEASCDPVDRSVPPI